MHQYRAAIIISATLLLVGCGGSGSSGGAGGHAASPLALVGGQWQGGGGGAGGGGTVLQAYPANGHPLLTQTTDPAILGAEDQVLTLTNNARNAVGANALIMHDILRQCARGHSHHMDVHSFFSHVNPEGDDPYARLALVGVTYDAAGENIAVGQPDAAAVMNSWMNSPGHRANIENPNFTHIGVGMWPTGGPYWTQVFARNPN